MKEEKQSKNPETNQGNNNISSSNLGIIQDEFPQTQRDSVIPEDALYPAYYHDGTVGGPGPDNCARMI